MKRTAAPDTPEPDTPDDTSHCKKVRRVCSKVCPEDLHTRVPYLQNSTLLAKGACSYVYLLPNGHVAKVQFMTESESYRRREDVLYIDQQALEREVEMQRRASEAGLAPMIHQALTLSIQDSPQVIHIIEMDAYDQTCWQLYQDQDFFLPRSNQLTPQAKQYLTQVFSLVTRLHELGISHNDVHSGNILYKAATKQYVLSDFGEACELEEVEARDARVYDSRVYDPRVYDARVYDYSLFFAYDTSLSLRNIHRPDLLEVFTSAHVPESVIDELLSE